MASPVASALARSNQSPGHCYSKLGVSRRVPGPTSHGPQPTCIGSGMSGTQRPHHYSRARYPRPRGPRCPWHPGGSRSSSVARKHRQTRHGCKGGHHHCRRSTGQATYI